MAGSSGSTCVARPVSTSTSSPARGAAETSSLLSSSRTRSALTIVMRSAMSTIAARAAGSTANPSWAAKRAARIMRSGSSSNDWRGSTGVRRTPAARSVSPSNGSTNVSSGSRTAIELTVKSRRERSPSRESPNATCGLRLVGSYSSER